MILCHIAHNTSSFDAPLMGPALLQPLCLDWCSSISFRALYSPFHAFQCGMVALQFAPALLGLNCHSYIAFHTPYPPPFLALLCWDSTPESRWCSSAWFGSSLFHSALHTPPFGAPRFLSALLSLDLVRFFFILHSSITIWVLLYSTQHYPSGASLFVVVAPLFHRNLSFCHSNPHLDSLLANIIFNLC